PNIKRDRMNVLSLLINKISLVKASNILLNTKGEVLSPLAFRDARDRIEAITIINSQHTEYGEVYSCTDTQCPANLERIKIFKGIPRIPCFGKHHPEDGCLIVQHQWMAKFQLIFGVDRTS